MEGIGMGNETVKLTAREKAIQDLLWASLQRDPEHKDRRRTGFGTKTVVGLTASIERVIKDTEAPRPQADVLLLTAEGYRRGQIETLEAKCECGANLYGIVRVHHCNEKPQQVVEPHECFSDARTWQDGKRHCQKCDKPLN